MDKFNNNISERAAALFAACVNEFGECKKILINRIEDGITVEVDDIKFAVIVTIDDNGAYIPTDLENEDDEPDCNQCVFSKSGCNYETSSTCIDKKVIYVFKSH